MKLSVVIPLYNEAGTIDQIVQRVRNAPFEKEIVIVDDCSTDGSREKLQALTDAEEIRVVLHDANRGKGAALRRADLRVLTGTYAHLRGLGGCFFVSGRS